MVPLASRYLSVTAPLSLTVHRYLTLLTVRQRYQALLSAFSINKRLKHFEPNIKQKLKNLNHLLDFTLMIKKIVFNSMNFFKVDLFLR